MSNSNTFFQNVSRGIKQNVKKHLHNKYREVNISWLYLKYLKHIPAGKTYYHKLFNSNTKFVNGQEYLHGITEVFIEQVYKQSLPANALVLDCGAHIGLSIIYLKKICPTARITAFEPDSRNFDLLVYNTTSHNLKDVTIVNKAVWTDNTFISFKAEGNMSSKIEFNNTDSNKIEAVRLKDYLNQKVDFLKLDIEGAEYDVLKDIEDKLINVDKLFLEYHGTFEQNNELCEIFNILERQEFKFYIKEATVVYDFPFIHQKSPSIPYDVQLNIFCFKRSI